MSKSIVTSVFFFRKELFFPTGSLTIKNTTMVSTKVMNYGQMARKMNRFFFAIHEMLDLRSIHES